MFIYFWQEAIISRCIVHVNIHYDKLISINEYFVHLYYMHLHI